MSIYTRQNYMPYNLRLTPARIDNSVLPASSCSTNYTLTTSNTHAIVHTPNMTPFTKDLCLALSDSAVILEIDMIIENKNAEPLKLLQKNDSLYSIRIFMYLHPIHYTTLYMHT